MIKIFIFFIVLIPTIVFGQVTVSGKIISQADTKPVAYASVFFSNATIGDKTGTDGAFVLKNVKPGQYQLVVSIIGFDPYNQTIIVDKSNIDLQTITIYPKSIVLNEVKIKPEVDFTRQRNYDWFKEEFLGKTELSKDCKILNPEVLDLDYNEKTGILTASTADFLVIQNNALGYKIKYLLKDFTLNNADELNKEVGYSGVVLFESLKGEPAMEQQWENRREETYRGSVRHFLKSALLEQLDKDGFRVLRLPANPERPADKLINKKIEFFEDQKDGRDSLAYWKKKSNLPKRLQKLLLKPLREEEFIKGPDKQGFYTLSNVSESTGNINDALYVSYDKYHRFNKSTVSKLSDPGNKNNTLIIFDTSTVPFDKNGNVLDPKDLTYDGVWSRDRLAGMLPLDYEPGATKMLAEDSSLIKMISTKLDAYAAKNPDQKAYLHFDKPYYTTGDTIYFKAYVTNGDRHQLTDKSGILYADLIGPDNKVNRSLTLQLTNGTAWGDFTLADSLKKGNYRVRAYTNLMRNEGDAAFFDQSIAVGSFQNTGVSESGISRPGNKAKPVIQFFPEGGSLVTGVRSKIAFKALAVNGMGIDVKGTIIDEDNKEVGSFVSAHLGMGYFYLTPAEKKTYRAKLSYANGTQDIIQLPQSEAKGIAMDITDQGRAYTIKIRGSKGWFQENKSRTYTLIACSGGKPYSMSCKLDNPEVILTLPKKDLRAGIAKITLFSADGEPLCERLLFVQSDDMPKLNLSSNKAIYNTREKASIALCIAGNVGGDYSASVIDESKVAIDENTEPTIINNLLLTSDLKGYVEQPNYYFIKPTDKTNSDLDLVMLTHGYRRFEWKQVLTNNPSSQSLIYQPEKGLVIAGLVKAGGKPVANGKVKLFSKIAGGLMLDTLTDKNGRFVFDNLAFADTTKFVLQARTATGQKNVDIELDKTDSSPALSLRTIPDTITNGNSISVYIQSSKQFHEEQKNYGINQQRMMLKEVVIKDKKKDPLLAHSENLNGAGNADQVITSEDMENLGYTSLYDLLRARGNNIEITKEHYLLSKHSGPNFNGQIDYMEIIVDGIPMPQRPPEVKANQPKPIDDLQVADIESIEIGLGARYGAIYGSRGAGGVLIVTTKRAKKVNNYYREAPGVIVYKSKGFYKAREFYSPQYDNPKTNRKMADLRSTIYWNPNIITDKDGKASFSFFNADGKGTYRVVIEGIDADGNLGRQVYRYTVE